jgi:hypothetical protein
MHFYDRKHREVTFAIGQWVWLCLIHRLLASLNVKGCAKLGPKFYGSFLILERIGDMTYRLQQPAGAKHHDVFHIRLLKPFKGEPPAETPALPPVDHGWVCAESEAVLHGRMARGHCELLVQWKGLRAVDATWTDLEEFWHLYPAFQLKDELLAEEGRNVMLGIQYQRCRNRAAADHGIAQAATNAAE